jgi:hypothetical protein
LFRAAIVLNQTIVHSVARSLHLDEDVRFFSGLILWMIGVASEVHG